jgi:hypothetical protein
MAYRKQSSYKPKTLWDYLFFNPRASSSFDNWKLIFESRRLCREVDRNMKRTLTPEQYSTYINYGKPERNPSWLSRLFGRSA